MKNKKLISIAVPVYNNEGSLEMLYNQIHSLFENELTDYNFEICFTNDGSKDRSLEILLKLRNQDNRIKITDFSGNFGQNAATVAAHKLSKGDAIITISADLQDPIELFPKMIKYWEEGNELIICFREKRNDGFLRKITSGFYYGLLRFHTSKLMPEGGFDFYLTSRKAIDCLNKIEDNVRIRSFQYDLFSLGFDPKLIAYERRKREHGISQFGFLKRLIGFTDALISVSYLPIRLMSLLGFLFATASFIYSCLIIYAWQVHKTPFKGWAPIIILLLLTSGIIMLMLGIIGEYIWRIFIESKKRPNYVIDKIYND